MANHKRGRPKNRRSGCLLCKPHKVNGTSPYKAARAGDRRRMEAADQQLGQRARRGSTRS